MKAFAYLRVSGRGQIDGDGFDRQLAAIETYSKTNGIEIAEVFREEGISGTKDLEYRPALASLIAALDENGTKTILIERLDRLARDLMVQESFVADFAKQGYTLVSVAEPDLCSTDPSRVLMRQIFGAIAQYDRAMVVLKLRGARQRAKARDGRCEGQKPFGHYEGEAPVLDRILFMHDRRFPHYRIAEILNTENRPSRSGRPWSPGVIGKILRRERA